MSSLLLKPCREYHSFSVDVANRDISQGHIDNLAESMASLCLLDLYPIVTNTERVSRDGQHRLVVCDQEKWSFYFIAGDDIHIDDVARANQNTKPYTLRDALYVYARVGIEPYVAFEQHLGTLIKSQQIVSWLRGLIEGGGSKESFIDGLFTFRRPEYAKVVQQRLDDYALYLPWVWTSKYRDAVANLTLNPLYDHKRMMGRIKKLTTRIQDHPTTAECMAELSKAYNYGMAKEKNVTLKVLGFKETVNPYDKKFTPITSSAPMMHRKVEPDKIVEVFKTHDLVRFKVHPSARPVDPSHLKSLTEAIKAKSLLRYYPIIVDRNFVVYDGQRRLMAARALNEPIYYIVASNISMPMMVQAGSRTKGWAHSDYMKHFCEMGAKEYIGFKAYCDRFPHVSIKHAIRALSKPSQWLTLSDDFKSGTFTMQNTGLAAKYGSSLALIADAKLRKSGVFQGALLSQMYNPRFDPNHLVERINGNPDKINTMTFVDMGSCLAQMDEVYNLWLPDERRINFRKLSQNEMDNRWDRMMFVYQAEAVGAELFR